MIVTCLNISSGILIPPKRDSTPVVQPSLQQTATISLRTTDIIVSPTPVSTPKPLQQLDTLQGTLDSLVISAMRNPIQDGRLDWSIKLPLHTDVRQVIAQLQGLIIPYVWIFAMEEPTEIPDGLDLVGSSDFNASVVLKFDSGEMAIILHSSSGVSLPELTFAAQLNGSVPDGITLNQLLPISLAMESTSPGFVRAIGSSEGVQVIFTLSHMPINENTKQFPLLNFTVLASAIQMTEDPTDGETTLVFSTTSQLTTLPIQSLNGSVQGQLDDSTELPSGQITAYVDRQRDGQLNWEIADLPGMDGVRQYRPILCLLYTSPSPRDATLSRMPSSA